jgi:succinoglycan biosynthesis transport protein ExoP
VSNNLQISPDGKWIALHDGSDRTFGLNGKPQDVPEQGGLDIGAIGRAVFYWRWLIAGMLISGMVIGLISSIMTTPMYRATVTMEVNPPSVAVTDSKNSPQTDGNGNFDLVATQIGLLKSRAIAERVARDLNLASNDGVVGKGGTPAARIQRATDVVASGIKVTTPENGSLISFTYTARSPQLAAAIANQIADSFISSALQRRYDASSYARKFLSVQISKTRMELEKTERALVAYAQAEGIINTSSGHDSAPGDVNSLQGESLVALNSALGSATAKRIEAESAYRQGTAVGATTDVTAGTAGLRSTRATLEAQYQEKRTLLKPDHPDMMSLQSQITEIDRQIAREASQVSSSRSNTLLATYRSAAASEAALRSRVSALKGSVLNLRGRSIQYNILLRDADTNRSLYDALLQRYKEVGVAAGIGSSAVSIVDHANVPGGPFQPNPVLDVAIGAVLGLLAGIGAAIALEIVYDTVKTRDDVRTKLDLACLGAIPKIEDNAFAESLADQRSETSEAYASVLAALRFSTDEGLPRSFMVTSTRPSEGKSSTSLALSQNMARLGHKVLLIDADLRKPVFRTANKKAGLTYLLTGESTVAADHISETQFDNLHLLPAGPIPPNPADLLSSRRAANLLRDLESQYDTIIVDAPPVLGLADALLIASLAKNILFVVESGKTRTAAARESLQMLRNTGTHMLGAVLTKVTRNAGHYGYYNYNEKQESIGQRAKREILMVPNGADAEI